VDSDGNESGAFFKVGYKFIKSPDFYLKGMRYAHLLKGTYVRPELAFTSYMVDDYIDYGYANSSGRYRVTLGAVLINVGKQWVFDDTFVLDWFVGAGYGFGDNPIDWVSHKAFMGVADGVPLALTSGLRIGFVF
jgi:hypothetical protein